MTDTQRYMQLQAEYKAGDSSKLADMYSVLYTLAYKAVNKRLGKSGASADIRQQKAHDAATYIIEQYIKRADFVIKDSVLGYLYTRITKELNYARNCDKMLVFTDVMPERADGTKRIEFIVTDLKTDTKTTYESAGVMLLNPVFKGLRRKRLAECLKNGTKWKNYRFEIIEI